jgi:hypothetical protein
MTQLQQNHSIIKKDWHIQRSNSIQICVRLAAHDVTSTSAGSTIAFSAIGRLLVVFPASRYHFIDQYDQFILG